MHKKMKMLILHDILGYGRDNCRIGNYYCLNFFSYIYSPNIQNFSAIELRGEGELSEKIGQMKLKAADGKMYLTDVADTEQILRLIQSIPSKKTEPFKM